MFSVCVPEIIRSWNARIQTAGSLKRNQLPHLLKTNAQQSAETGEQIQVPRVSSNEDLSTGQETVWDCIYFGSYPSAEVVRSSWDSVDDYAVMDGDVIRDDDLYKRLSEAG